MLFIYAALVSEQGEVKSDLRFARVARLGERGKDIENRQP